jgi:hypothetical protein
MNERYKELEEQCTEQLIDYDVGKRYDQVDHRKLAELLIRECVNCAEREIIRNGDTEHNRAIHEVIDSIKKHFGVK